MYLLALLLVSLLPAGAAVPLVTAGKPAAEVVVADGNAVARFAATELVTLVERSTGARLPVVSAPTPDCAHVYLGAGEAATKAGVSVAGLAPEGFRLRTVGSELFVVGDDFGGDAAVLNRSVPTRAGTLSGVYELLERVAGVRFYWHDELGTIVPKRTDLTVPDLDVTQAPHWLYRSLPYSPEGQTSKLFGRRLRLGQAYGISHGHNWYRILPAEKYGQEHPEYFAEIKGERQARYYSGHHGGQVCTSNPEVVEVFARHIIEYFDATPAASMYSVSPNDGGGFCECANCRALDLESWGDEHPGQPVMTDRILTFYNAVAERVAAKHPDKYLGAYIYSYYRKPPVKTRPHPNLALVFAINSIGTHGEEWTREKAWIDAWTALTNNFYLYDIMWLNDWSLGLPAPVTRHAVDKLQHLGGTSMRGGYLYAAPSYESLGPLHYLTAKLMWDPKADVAALESEYYADLYGPAAGEVKAWYDLLESRVRKMRLEGLDTTDPALIRLASGTQRDVAVMLAAYQPILAQADALLDQAEARELTTEQRQRLARLRDHHDLLRTTVVAYLGAEHLTRLATWDPDEVKRTQEAIDERAKLLEKLRSYAPTLVDILVEQDKSITAPITPAAAAYQLARRAGPSVVTALPAAAPPKIDGEIDKPWQGAAWRDLVNNRSGSAPRGPARAALLRSSDSLYLLVEGWDEDGANLIAKATARGTLALFADDHLEWFLVPPGERGYYHLALGAGGALWTQRHPTGEAARAEPWDPQVEAAVKRHAHGWNAELRLPLAALEPQPKGDAAGWKTNIYRGRRSAPGGTEYTSVAATFGGHHLPDKFAVLRFGEAGGKEHFVDGSLEGIDAARFAKVFRPGGQGGSTVELATDYAYAGQNSIKATVVPGSMASVTVTSPAEAGKAYRITLAHRNQVASLNPEVRPDAPNTRVICRDATGQAVTPTSGYSWSGTPAQLQPGEWRLHAHTFTAPPGTTQVSFTVFLHHPGEYRLDSFRIEAIE